MRKTRKMMQVRIPPVKLGGYHFVLPWWKDPLQYTLLVSMSIMHRRRFLFGGATICLGLIIFNFRKSMADNLPKHLKGIDPNKIDWREKSEAYWREVLTSEQFSVCRSAGTERPFSGAYCSTKAQGDYRCLCCGQLLFSSNKKFDSGTGWPSFTEAAAPGVLEFIDDTSHGMMRVEVRCKRCGAHLGHVFDDGPPPTGKRFCINSVCLIHESQ